MSRSPVTSTNGDQSWDEAARASDGLTAKATTIPTMPTTASSQGRFRVTSDRYELAPRVCSALRSIPPTDLPNPVVGFARTDSHGAASYGNAVPYAELMAVSSFPTIGLSSDEERRPELQAGGVSAQRPAVVAGTYETR